MKKGLIIGIVAGIIIICVVIFLLIYTQKNLTDETELENVPTNVTDDVEISQAPEETYLPNNLSNTICNQLPTSSEFGSEDTYYCLAVVNQNSSFCEKINEDMKEPDPSESMEDAILDDENPKNICLAISIKNSSYCKKITKQDAKKTCYNTLAQLIWDIEVCDKIDYSQEEKQVCYYNFVNALYWENKSDEITTEYCSKIEDNIDEKTCLAFKARDVSLCGSNKNCLTFFPQEMSFCNGVTFKDEDECLRDRALVNRDVSICATLSEPESRDDCYLDFSGHIQPDLSICDKIIGIERKRGCYINVAINLAE